MSFFSRLSRSECMNGSLFSKFDNLYFVELAGMKFRKQFKLNPGSILSIWDTLSPDFLVHLMLNRCEGSRTLRDISYERVLSHSRELLFTSIYCFTFSVTIWTDGVVRKSYFISFAGSIHDKVWKNNKVKRIACECQFMKIGIFASQLNPSPDEVKAW